MMVTREKVLEALEGVHDPCSLTYGNDITFVELGMIESVEVEGANVGIHLLLDDPNCIYMARIADDIEEAVGKVDGVEQVVVTNRGDDVWTEDRLTDRGRQKLDAYREKKRAKLMQIGSLRR